MNRRSFFALLAGATLAPERLLWVPGKKLISIPSLRTYTVADLVEAALHVLRSTRPPDYNAVEENFAALNTMLDRWNAERLVAAP